MPAAILSTARPATVAMMTAIADGAQPLPSFGDGLAAQRVLDAVARSAASGNSWERVNN